MEKIEHIGIAVRDLAAAAAVYEKLLGTTVYKTEDVASEQVRTAFLQCGPNKVELLEAMGDSGPIAKFIEKKGEGIHHIAFEVADIRAEMARLKSEGFILLSDEPKPGADNKLVCFVHPKSAGGVLVELCEDRRRGYPPKAKTIPLNIDEKINLFQFRHKLIIPADLAKYFKLKDSEIDDYNEDMFTFYKFDEFKSVKEELGDYSGIPDYTNIVNTLPQHENCFVFLEYSIYLMVYAIMLYEYETDHNEIYVILGDNYKLIANSFTEFIKLYRYEMNNGDFNKLFV